MSDTDVDDQQTDGAEDGDEKKSSGKKKIILLAAIGVLVLAIGGGAAAYFTGMLDFGGGGQVAEATAPEPDPVYFYNLPVLTVNLATIDGQPAYLKMEIALELPHEDMVQKIEPFMPRILDTFHVYLRELRTTDLNGSSGLFRLKEELQRRINIAVYPARINNVLFKNLLIQ